MGRPGPALVGRRVGARGARRPPVLTPREGGAVGEDGRGVVGARGDGAHSALGGQGGRRRRVERDGRVV